MSTKESATRSKKDRDDWLSGNESMTDAQASDLQRLRRLG